MYGPNQDRIQHSDSNGRVTKYVGGIYEEVTRNGETQKIHYVGDMALFISKGANTNATYHYEYLHRDHIGSITALSKGTVNSVLDVQWQANGTWGERRYQQWNGPLDNALIPASTARGFTDHEHLDSVGLIHMNGRVYDPELGRFMSADPFVQSPYNTQSYNRYSYVFNNPLSFTDPSGYKADMYEDYGGRRGDEIEEVIVIGRRGGGTDFTSLSGAAAYTFSQDWQNYMNRYQQSMVNMGGYAGGIGYTSISIADKIFVSDALGAVDSALNGNVGGAVYGAAVTLIKPLKAAEKVADLAKNAKAAEKKVEKALTTKRVDTPHTINTSGKAPKTAEPNSIIETRRADGSSSVTYYDDKGRAFSREDYGQQSTHGSLGQRADGRSVAHEHRFDYNDRGYPIKQDVYRPLSENGTPAGPWRGE